MMLKYSDPRDDFQKTLKRFTQVDGHAKNTKQVCVSVWVMMMIGDSDTIVLLTGIHSH